jgi:hypothetical protein
VNAVMNLQVQLNEGNFLTSCKPVSFSRRTVLYGVSKWLSTYLVYLYMHMSEDGQNMIETCSSRY